MNLKHKIILIVMVVFSIGSYTPHEHQVPPCVCMPGAPSGWWDGRCWDYGWHRLKEITPNSNSVIPSCKP
jgi:hypothetical protein